MMQPDWIGEVLERRRVEDVGSNDAPYPSERWSEWERQNSRMKVKVE